MTRPDLLDRGREAFDRHAWGAAFELLASAEHATPLDSSDLERLATAAYLIGRNADGVDRLVRAHQAYLAQGDREGAARCAFWLAFQSFNTGEPAQGRGWAARAERVLHEGALDSVVHGYLLVLAAIQRIGTDPEAARNDFTRAGAVADRFGDTDLAALARHGCGRALIRLGRAAEGVSLLDEAMVAVTAGEVSAILAGDIYCSVLEACDEIFDLGRAQEWTAALGQWCQSQPDLVPYRGQCLVRRAELFQLRGAWPDAMDCANQACDSLSRPPHPAVGAALYQRAELHRLRGEFERAEDAYRRAGQAGRSTQPGLAQLRLAQGHVQRAAEAIRGALDESAAPRTRARLLAAGVEVMLAAGAHDVARAAAQELSETAAGLDAPFLRAAAARARGAVLLATGDARAGRDVLRQACALWTALDAPHETARTRELVGLACRALGDRDGAAFELAAAREVFARLGAAPDIARLDRLTADTASTRMALSPREMEVLRLVAAGRSNRAIAGELGISEKTVARHVSNIYTKIDVSTRAAATAFAYQHDLV